MAEKNLNTRIKLRYDSLQAWAAANPTLLDGEIAIAYLPPKGEGQVPAATSEAVLFKVGPGAFNSLPWASALAADVYDWAKLTYSDFLKEIEKTFYTETEINTLLAGYYTKSEVEDLIEAAEGRAATDAKNKADKALEDAKSYADTEIQKAVTGGTAGLATEKYVNDAVAPKADKTYVDTELAKKLDKTTYEAYIDGKSMSDVELKTYAENQASAAQTAAEATAASALSAARTAITTEIGQAVAPLATTEALNNVDAKFADYTKTAELPTDLGDFTNDAGYAKTTDVVTNEEFAAFESTNSKAIENAAKAGTDAAAAAEQNAKDYAKDYADDIKDAILGEGIKDTFDTLVEIQTWIEGAGVNATELTEAIAAEAKIREEEDAKKVDKTTYETHLTTQAQKDAAQDKALTDAIAAEVQRAEGKYEEKGVAQGLINGLDVTVEGMGKGKTLATLTETDGKIAATFQDIEITSSQISDLDTGVHAVSLASGTNNGTVKLTVDGKDTDNIAVTGLGSAAFVDASDYVSKEELENKVSIAEVVVSTNGGAVNISNEGFSIMDWSGESPIFNLHTEVAGGEELIVEGTDQAKAAWNEWLGVEAKLPTSADYGVLSVTAGDGIEVTGTAQNPVVGLNETSKGSLGKADSALQEITAGTGLKVSDKSANKQQIDFDETVTFIFNCGGASL